MSSEKMRPGELEVGHDLVASLIEAQFPQYGELPITKVESTGTDHAMFRLGSELVLRLPRIASAAAQVNREQRWLPIMAPQLNLQIPTPVGMGRPGPCYDMHWSIYRWLPGDNAFDAPIEDLDDAAVSLGRFGATLRQIDAGDGPPSFRGGPLAVQEADVLAAITDLGDAGIIDQVSASDAWQQIIGLPQWDKPPVWTHSDLLPGNLLVRNGQLSAVIDFGCVGVGDPACDLMAAWTVFTADERDTFRQHSDVDDDTWARGRGWAFGFGLMAYHYYHIKNPALAAVGLRSIKQALPEFADQT